MINDIVSDVWLLKKFFYVKLSFFFKLVFGLNFCSERFLLFIFSLNMNGWLVVLDALWNFAENALLFDALSQQTLQKLIIVKSDEVILWHSFISGHSLENSNDVFGADNQRTDFKNFIKLDPRVVIYLARIAFLEGKRV